MPNTKTKGMTKAEMTIEMNRLAKEIAALRGEAVKGIDDIKSELGATHEVFENAISFGTLAQSIISGLPLKEFAAKATLGFIWGYTLGVVGMSASAAIALLAIPAWLSFVVNVLLAMCILFVALKTAGPVVNFTYNMVTKMGGFVRREALAARTWVEDAAEDIRVERSRQTEARSTAH